MRSSHLLTALTGAIPAAAQGRATSSYVDPATGIAFQSFSSGSGYRFGMVLPSSSDTSPNDAIIQLVSPLDSGSGWAGVDFGPRMLGPLLLVAWPKGEGDASSVMIAPRIASSYRPDGCVLYTATPISIRPIAKGTFANGTHLSATFLCAGCVNAASFDPRASATQEFAFAYSRAKVDNPGTLDAQLPRHDTKGELYGPFGVDVAGAKSSDYAKFAAMAEPGGNAGSPAGSGTQTAAGPRPTETGTGGAGGVNSGQGTSHAVEGEYNRMSPGAIVALAFVGVLYMLQGFSMF